jgi:hypothetical protein
MGASYAAGFGGGGKSRRALNTNGGRAVGAGSGEASGVSDGRLVEMIINGGRALASKLRERRGKC